MIYQDFQDKKLSALGFGGMRLPTIGEGFSAQVPALNAASANRSVHKISISPQH